MRIYDPDQKKLIPKSMSFNVILDIYILKKFTTLDLTNHGKN